jgi:hypothetical protein
VLSGVQAIAAGFAHTCALLTTGAVSEYVSGTTAGAGEAPAYVPILQTLRPEPGWVSLFMQAGGRCGQTGFAHLTLLQME